MNLTQLLRPTILALKPYTSARDEFSGVADVYLDANENPYPTAFNRYPDPLQQKLKSRIAEIKNVKSENIFLGNGSDEPIDLLVRACCEPGRDSIALADPTYGMYEVCATINNVTIKRVNLRTDFTLDAEAVLNQCDESTKLIFVCSPNNPTGNLQPLQEIEKLLSNFSGLVIVDEAYIDFASTPGFLPILSRYSNLVVLQTFSKAWGLAGLRLGMCFASKEIISILNKIKYPYNISSATQSLALEALQNTTKKDKEVAEIITQRLWLTNALTTLPGVSKVYPSDANFVLVAVNNARDIYEKLVAKKIIVRDRSSVVLCQGCLRITVGTPEENKKLIQTLLLVMN